MLENELLVLHLKVSWRSWPMGRSGMALCSNTQDIPFQSLTLTKWTSSAMLGEVWKDNRKSQMQLCVTHNL